MGQEDVYDFLVKNKGKKFTPNEIMKLSGLSRGCVLTGCKRLRKTNFVKYENKDYREKRYWVQDK